MKDTPTTTDTGHTLEPWMAQTHAIAATDAWLNECPTVRIAPYHRGVLERLIMEQIEAVLSAARHQQEGSND